MKIGLLATGDELVNGDILNTNGQRFARLLTDQGFNLGMHCVVSDEELQIVDAIQYLLKNHNCLIITGGLGPTSDDRTRFGLAKALEVELEYQEICLQHIARRLMKFNLNLSKQNEQQALFPKNAKIIMNPNGTACGCEVTFEDKLIYMLPGPPFECLPMFEKDVLPNLMGRLSQSKKVIHKWQLFGVPEGEMAAKLDALFKSETLMTGYRWHYPYLEFKLVHDSNEKNLETILKRIEDTIAPHVISDHKHSASDLLIQTLEHETHTILIQDKATKGLLEHTLTNCLTLKHVYFSRRSKTNYDVTVKISGLNEVWTTQFDASFTQLNIEIRSSKNHVHEQIKIPFRSRQVVVYAVEYISYVIRKAIENI